MIVANNCLLKCSSNDKSLILPDSITSVFGSAFDKNVESIYGENISKIFGKLSLDDLKVLYLPNLIGASMIDCPNLIEFIVNEDFHSNKPNINPLVIGTKDVIATYSHKSRELFEYISKMYNLNVYSKNSNVIYFNNGKIEFTYGDDSNIINSIIYLIKLLNMIPDNIRKIIDNSGYKIFITNNYFRTENEFLAGITYNKLKLCIVSEMNELELLHELGHIYDSVKNISATDEFNDIYNNEKDKITCYNNISLKHIRSSSREFFAESFKKIIVNKEAFFEECPLTKSFLDNEFSKYDKVKRK